MDWSPTNLPDGWAKLDSKVEAYYFAINGFELRVWANYRSMDSHEYWKFTILNSKLNYHVMSGNEDYTFNDAVVMVCEVYQRLFVK